MAMPTPQQAAQKWQRNLSASTQTIIEGVNRVQESPTAKAARSIDRMVAGFQNAAADGKIQDGLNAVTLEDWKSAMIDKGASRIASGAAQAEPKFARFLDEFLPFLEAGVRQLDSEMPRGDTEQNIQRAVSMMRHNAKFRRRRSSLHASRFPFCPLNLPTPIDHNSASRMMVVD